MNHLKKIIEDTLLKILLKKDFNKIDINEVQKQTKISQKKFFSTRESKTI